MKKVFKLEGIKLYHEDEERKFSGYASTFGNEDRVGDVVLEGAFAKSLDQHKNEGTMPAMLFHHDLKRPIGKWTGISEDSKGLKVEGSLTSGVRDSDEAYALLKDGALNSMSIGYRVKKEHYDRDKKVNQLAEIDLHEISLVTIPANQEATVSAVKDSEGQYNIRELEVVLRDAGLSRKEAKALLAEGFKSLTDQNELIEDAETKCDATDDARQIKLREMLDKLASIKPTTTKELSNG